MVRCLLAHWVVAFALVASARTAPEKGNVVWNLPTGMSGNWSGNVTTSPTGPRSVVLPDQGKDFLEISEPDYAGNVYFRQRAFDQIFVLQQDGQIEYWCVWPRLSRREAASEAEGAGAGRRGEGGG